MSYDVFISYSSADSDWAQALQDKLESNGVHVYLDKTRLSIAQPYQEQLFAALNNSQSLVLVWSNQVRDMQGTWKEWIISEREHFRQANPTAPIIYTLIDDALPQVDAQDHMLDQLRQGTKPSEVPPAAWKAITDKIKEVVFSDRIEIDCYVLACTNEEFRTLHDDQNLSEALTNLGLKFDQVRSWYGDRRDDWQPAGGRSISEVLSELEGSLTNVLAEPGVPLRYGNRQLVVRTEIGGLWTPVDAQAKNELDRLSKLEFVWCLVDPLSVYHRAVDRAVHRIGSVLKSNPWLSVFVLDPTGYLRDRSRLRDKLQMDFSEVYQRLVRPSFDDTLSCPGAIDAWHVDDFERVFREVIRRRRAQITPQEVTRASKSSYARFGLSV